MKQSITGSIRVAVADPSHVVLSGFAKIFESSDRIQLVGSVVNLQHLKLLLQREPANITIIDWSLLRGDMNQTPFFIRDISGSTKVLISGMGGRLCDRKLAFDIGAKGVLSRRSTSEEVRKAITRVAAGRIWIEKRFADALLEKTFTEKIADGSIETRIKSLTPRERQVVECVCRAMKSKEVAASLQISENTVSHHLSSVFAKLDVKDRVGLVNFAYWNELHASHRDRSRLSREDKAAGKARAPLSRLPLVDRHVAS